MWKATLKVGGWAYAVCEHGKLKTARGNCVLDVVRDVVKKDKGAWEVFVATREVDCQWNTEWRRCSAQLVNARCCCPWLLAAVI